MANSNTTSDPSTYSAFGIARREDLQYEIFTGTAESLIAAGLIGAHQIPGQPGAPKTKVCVLPDETQVRDEEAHLVPGFKRIFKRGTKLVVTCRFDDAEISRRAACAMAKFTKDYETNIEELAWQAMLEGIAKCCFGEPRLVSQTKV